jgi:hypothetical protein
MRGTVVLALAAAALCVSLGVSALGSASPAAQTSLTLTYWPDGGQGSVAPRKWTLRCNPTGGTLRTRGAACRRLATGGAKLFAPVPRDAVCTQVYGGPFEARVVGVVDGRKVWARFARTNGCQIARWDRLSPWLLPRVGSA